MSHLPSGRRLEDADADPSIVDELAEEAAKLAPFPVEVDPYLPPDSTLIVARPFELPDNGLTGFASDCDAWLEKTHARRTQSHFPS